MHLRLVQRLVGSPEAVRCPLARWSSDGVRQVTDVFEAQVLVVRVAVENLKGGDFILVVLDELPEVIDSAPCPLGRIASM